MLTSLHKHFYISKESWTPKSSKSDVVNHYSIPNFDKGVPHQEAVEGIKSNKFLISRPCVLISKLNPDTPRIWLIEKLLPGTSVCSTEFVVLIPEREEDLRYLYFLLKSDTVRSRLKETATGTSNSHQRVRPDAILELEVPWIVEERKRTRTANFLWMLERKIQINNETSKTLEGIAQTIFESWFIRFDPVKTKIAGQKPVGMDDATSALFPDSMEESEVGLIPKGWEVKALGEVCAATIGGLWGGDEETQENPDSYQCVRGVDMDDLKASGYAPRVPVRWDKSHNFSRRLLTGTQILIAGSGAGPVAKSILWDESMNNLFALPVVFSNFVKRFECNSHEMASFVSSILSNMYESREIFTFVNGTSVPNLQDRELLIGKKIVVPSIDLLHAFDSIKRNSIKYKYTGENSNLIAIRDSILPRLIAGDLHISEELFAS